MSVDEIIDVSAGIDFITDGAHDATRSVDDECDVIIAI